MHVQSRGGNVLQRAQQMNKDLNNNHIAKRWGVAAIFLSLVAITYLTTTQARTHGPDSVFVKEVEYSKKFDSAVKLARLKLGDKLDPRHDSRGWMLDPLAAAEKSGLKEGSTSCLEVHVGSINPGNMRGNHRHHYCNETIIVWGAKQRVRMENLAVPAGYSEVTLGRDEIAVIGGPAHLAHAITNLDETETVYLLACQDARFSKVDPQTDYNVWKDL